MQHLVSAYRCIFAVLALQATCAAAESLTEARKQYLTGHYAEARELYEKLVEAEPVVAALGLARSHEATGGIDKALDVLKQAANANPKAAALPAELARLAFERGDYRAADEHVAAALKLDRDQLLARWITCELARVRGKLDEAAQGYHWFVRYYNGHDVQDPDAIRLIGLAAAQYARWNRLSDQFRFLVNDLLPDALKLDRDYWPVHYEAGMLFVEKYNEADATKELQAALAINPQAAELHVARAVLALQSFELGDAQTAVDRALEINPRLLAAHQLQADIHLANFDNAKAIEALEKALPLNLNDEDTLGRLAAAYIALEGLPKDGVDSRAAKIIAQVTEANPHAGEFFLALADGLDRTRRFPAAAHYYQQATDVMPQLTSARGELGMVLMRLGDEAPAKKLLSESFDIDPFNLRVSNTIKVLEVLDGYETLETEHFIIKFDPKYDKLMARYAAHWLEEIHPQLCRQLGFEPPQKSLFEIFNKAKNTDGHGWFSARMVGLPHIHTIGACAGKMVAMQSPVGGQRFNWGRVLKHEFVHVINLQQTHFNIPHWYTEALAVLNEGYPRPAQWNELLAQRVPAGKTFNLDTINLGFIRPHSSDDWTMAYCQAELYAEYMLEKHGPDALAKMLTAYADNLNTKYALRRSFGVEQAEFEQGYREHLERIVKGLSVAAPAKPMKLEDLQKALEADPENPDLLAQVAQAQFKRQKNAEARRLVDAALKAQPKHQLAAYVRAQLHLKAGEEKEAAELMAGALNDEAPQPDLLAALVALRIKANDNAEAARLLELGVKHDPTNSKWAKSLAAVYLKSGETEKLAAVLTRLAAEDSEDLPMRKKLAELALTRMDWPAALRYATEALHIDVMDEDVHRLLAEAQLGSGDPAAAVEEYEVAVEIKPGQLRLRFALAQALVAAKQPDKARAALDDILKRDAKYPGAAQLLESLKSE